MHCEEKKGDQTCFLLLLRNELSFVLKIEEKKRISNKYLLLNVVLHYLDLIDRSNDTDNETSSSSPSKQQQQETGLLKFRKEEIEKEGWFCFSCRQQVHHLEHQVIIKKKFSLLQLLQQQNRMKNCPQYRKNEIVKVRLDRVDRRYPRNRQRMFITHAQERSDFKNINPLFSELVCKQNGHGKIWKCSNNIEVNYSIDCKNIIDYVHHSSSISSR